MHMYIVRLIKIFITSLCKRMRNSKKNYVYISNVDNNIFDITLR